MIGLLDFITGYKLSFSIFYLIPILMVTLLADIWTGLIISLFGSIAWFTADYLSNQTYEHLLIPYWNASVRLAYFVIVTITISKLKSALEREKELSGIDFLTKIANNKAFYEFADREIKRLERYHHPISIAYFDCDNFKEVNDRHGHLTGDSVLKEVADILRNNIRTTDFPARMGGDEFAVIMPETDEVLAHGMTHRLQSELIAAMKKHDWPITFSIGLVTFNEAPESADSLIKEADNLMYEKKKNGKDGIKQNAHR